MNESKDLDQLLRAALHTKEPSSHFAARVVARATHTSTFNWKSWAAGCIAASMLLGTLGVREIEQRRERRRGEFAKQQLVQALSITSHTLQRIQKKLDGLNHD